MDRVLEDLAKVPWEKYRTVRSEHAEHISKVLKDALIQSNDDEMTAEILEDELFHQGWRPNAAIVAAPFICKMLHVVSTNLRLRMIDLLVHIAVGFENECLGSAGITGTNCSYDPAAYQAVAAEASLVIPLASGGTAEEVVSACRFLAWFPHLTRQTLPLLRELCLSGTEDEQVAAYVARGLLKDNVEASSSSFPRVRYASNIAHCETGTMTNAHLAVFVEMSGWRYQKEADEPFGEWRNEPYGFTLGVYAAEVLKRSGADVLRKFQEYASPGPMLALTETH